MRHNTPPAPTFPKPRELGYESRKQLHDAIFRYMASISKHHGSMDEDVCGTENGIHISYQRSYFYYFILDDIWRDIPEFMLLSFKDNPLLECHMTNGREYSFKWRCPLNWRRAFVPLLRSLYEEEAAYIAAQKEEKKEQERIYEENASELAAHVSELVKSRKEAE